MSEIEVGEAMYRLRRPVEGVFVTARDGSSEFWVEGFSPFYVGRGPLTVDAYNDWREQLHVAFQELYGKRPFEMAGEESLRWNILDNMIDVVSYQNETPVLVRQLGQVTRVHRGPRLVTWADGWKESVALDLTPPEFARFKPGQPFEAIVERESVTGHLRRVRYVQRIGPLRKLSDGELAQFWNSLQGTSALSESTRDWSSR